MSFLPGDRVTCVDGRYLAELKSKPGEILVRIKGYQDAYVVEFGNDAFVMAGSSLHRSKATPKAESEVELEKLKRRLEAEG